MLSPQVDDSLDTIIASQYNHNKDIFNATAREWTLSKANRTEEELLVVIDDDINDKFPARFYCQHSGRLMVEPMICIPSLHIYEEEVILKIIELYGKDPISQDPITKSSLVRDMNLRREINEYRNLCK